MNADVYVKVLKEHMHNFFCNHGSEVFMHNSAPCHKIKKVSFPGNSPDLNPIENCWQKMKKL